MNNGWKTEPLMDVTRIFNGNSISEKEKKANFLSLKSGVPYIGTKDVGFDHRIAYDSGVRIPANRAHEFKLAPSDSVFICAEGGSAGRKIAYNSQDVYFGNKLYAICPNPELNSKFVFYYCISDDFSKLFRGAMTGLIGGVSLNKFKAIPISFPPIGEQRRIVAILDEAFEVIDTAKQSAEKNLRNARALFESGFRQLTSESAAESWTRTTVKEIAATKKGSIRTGPFGSQLLHSEFVDHGVAVLGIDNAVANEFRWGKSRFITPEKYRQLERYRVYPGDVLITIMGTCGRCAIVPDEIPIAINTKHLCCITLDRTKCLPGYLHAYFLYHKLAQEFLAKRAKGSIMAGLNMGIIQELPVLLPPIARQREVVKSTDGLKEETQRLESVNQRKLVALDELKKSLLQRAFSGELTMSNSVLEVGK